MPRDPVSSRINLTPTAAAPAMARRHVASSCAGWPIDQVNIALLLTSELVTNALLHARNGPENDQSADPSPIVLQVLCESDVVRIEVSDSDPRPAKRPSPGEGAETGRGLLIVESLATRWGTQADGVGKTVWFELRMPESGG